MLRKRIETREWRYRRSTNPTRKKPNTLTILVATAEHQEVFTLYNSIELEHRLVLDLASLELQHRLV